jgi:predicted nucleic acid-binding protein
MKFWDSSAIVALLAPQAMTATAERVIATDRDILVWWATRVECVSALARLGREGRLGEGDIEAARRRLDAILDRSDTVDPTSTIRDRACRLVRVHPLRAGDALQLAAALELRESGVQDAQLVTFDTRLADAARREGLEVH